MPPRKRKPAARSAVRPEPLQYMIAEQPAALLPFSVQPVPFENVLEQLERDVDIQVQRVIEPKTVGAFTVGGTVPRRIVVAQMAQEKAADLGQSPHVVLEEDYELFPLAAPLRTEDPITLTPFGLSTTWYLSVRGPDGSPVPDASVFVYGAGNPVQGRTDAQGDVEVTLVNESTATVRAVYVNPQSDYWSLWLDRPRLNPTAVNEVVLEPLTSRFPEFPGRQLFGWGQRAMRLDHLPPTMDGRGIKVAVIDSGSASLTHPDLRHVVNGMDLTASPPAAQGWTVDEIAHGSHCAGVIAGADNDGGIRGFAPGAEVHALRIFPGGHLSTLFDALDYCIERQIDVVNMSLGTGGSSDLFLDKIREAKAAGVSCIVAAGNTGGEVQFPGLSQDVLTVAAIGKEGEFPPTSYHAQVVGPRATAGGLFSATFTCHGPQIDVCAPGVAVVSSVPDRGFAAWDGTSMAAPHVTGLAALVLAHHPELAEGRPGRNAARVERLFQILRDSATPVDVGDPHRTGAGMPDAVRALALELSPEPVVLSSELQQLLDGLGALMAAAGLVPATG